MGYDRNAVFCCPFYACVSKYAVTCEGGEIALPEMGTMRQYVMEYCTNINGWRRCTVARALLRHYEAQEA